jgi:hypothetical protein
LTAGHITDGIEAIASTNLPLKERKESLAQQEQLLEWH